MPTFVLIPGAGGSSWVWSRVTGFLVEAGHEAIAVDLPGDDECAGLARYCELVVGAIGSRSDVVLVAGSLGAFTAPLVCERAPVRELVFWSRHLEAPQGSRRRPWLRLSGSSKRSRSSQGRPMTCSRGSSMEPLSAGSRQGQEIGCSRRASSLLGAYD